MATMLERIEALNKAEAILIKDLRNYITNKTIPLEYRWYIFRKSNLGDCRPSIESFDCFVGKEIEGICGERWSRHCVFEELEHYEKNLNSSDDHSVEINIYKENVMSSFVKEWINNW